MPVLLAALLIGGCSGDDETGSSSSSQTPQQRPSQSQQRQGQQGQGQQGRAGQMQRPGQSQTLSASDVSEEQIQTAARIAVSIQSGTQEDRMRIQKEMQKKYGNPQQLDSTEKQKAHKEMRRRQMELRKKQMEILQKEAKKEGMEPQMFQRIMRSAQQDSTLRTRIRTAMKDQMKQQMTTPNQQNR